MPNNQPTSIQSNPLVDHWYTLPIPDLIQSLDTSIESGLNEDEAGTRLAQHGANELAEAPPTSFLALLWNQFNNFVVFLLLGAALISGFLGEGIEAGAIMAIVILNAFLGMIQEHRAERALAALRKMAAPEAQVVRGGRRLVIPSRDLVPGDIVFLEAGNYIPADIRLLDTANLRIEEASLTGESVPVNKDAAIQLESNIPLGDRRNSAFMSTLVSYGRGKGVVAGTGMNTQIGKIARMLQQVEEEPTPLQRRLDQLGKTLGWAALSLCGLVFLVGWIRGYDPLEMFLIAISLAIAAVPEGLPAVVTISLALGMREMIKRNSLIRRLSSVETLGSATVIGSDKTGTLTQNEMTVTRMWVDGQFFEVTGNGYSPKGDFRIGGRAVALDEFPAVTTALWVASLNNDAFLEKVHPYPDDDTYRVIGDPTEGALVVAATKADPALRDLLAAYPRQGEIPFDSVRKRMVTIHQVHDPKPEDLSPFYDDSYREAIAIAHKGAPDIILDLCTHYQGMDDKPIHLDEDRRKHILSAIDEMTEDALRVLAVAYRVDRDLIINPAEPVPDLIVEKDLIFAGLIGMIDPPRPEVKAALDTARAAGIRTIMITGDYPKTAQAIAQSIGLLAPGHKVLAGTDLDEMDQETLINEVATTDVFARVSPEHKVRIVEALRARGEIVAMTGDGVNDAPALKRANIGVAMGITGTDVAKETADMVLTDDNYASIVAAVEQGRVIYSNIRKFVYYLLSCNLAEIAIIFLATMAGLPSPLTPIQLLWLNLITDGAPALALGLEKGDPDIMLHPPRKPDEPIINRSMKTGISNQTIAITTVTLLAYWIGLNKFPALGGYNGIADTMAFVTLSFSELLRAYTARSERHSVFKIGVFKNRTMNWAVLSSLLLLVGVIYVPFLQTIFDTAPLTWLQWEIVLPLLVIPSMAAEITKWVSRRGGVK